MGRRRKQTIGSSSGGESIDVFQRRLLEEGIDLEGKLRSMMRGRKDRAIKLTRTDFLIYDMWKIGMSIDSILHIIQEFYFSYKKNLTVDIILEKINEMYELEVLGVLSSGKVSSLKEEIIIMYETADLYRRFVKIRHGLMNLGHTVDVLKHLLRETGIPQIQKDMMILDTVTYIKNYFTDYELDLITSIVNHARFFMNIEKKGLIGIGRKYFLPINDIHTDFFFYEIMSQPPYQIEETIQLKEKPDEKTKDQYEILVMTKNTQALVWLVNNNKLTTKTIYLLKNEAENKVHRIANAYTGFVFSLLSKRREGKITHAHEIMKEKEESIV